MIEAFRPPNTHLFVRKRDNERIKGISTAFYFDGVTYLSDEDARVFSRLIVATILLQLAVTFICSFFLIGLCTIDSYKTSIFFESIRSSAQILEFAWLTSIFAFVVSLYLYVQGRSEDIRQDIDFLFWPLALGSILLLWIMVHRLRSQIWHGEDFLVGFDVGSLLHLLDYYIKEDIRDGQLNLHVDGKFQCGVMEKGWYRCISN